VRAAAGSVTVESIRVVTDELVAAVARFVPQLSARRQAPRRSDLEELLAQSGTSLLVARDGAEPIGMLTLLLYRIPTGARGRIEDVVVDESARGKGAGEALTRAALELAAAAGIEEIELTSSPSRAAANRLYPRLGFEQRATNVYVWRPSR
jgi:ribosomal protein S18 acetylase RimI-like enzyme